MRFTFFGIIVAAGVMAMGVPQHVEAGVISRACMKSDRKAANSALCGCIQKVADVSLSWGDQRRAAAFFKSPHKAQETRQSDRQDDEVFWLKYKSFGARAEQFCR